MCRKAISTSLLLLTAVFCVAALADDQSSSQKSVKSDGKIQSDQATPSAGMMGKGMMGGGMQSKEMMGGPMMERGMKMMEMNHKMQKEMQADDADNDKLVMEMKQATGQKKIDAMEALLTRLVAQRKTMNEKMGTMHADMMQMMMETMGADIPHKSGASDKNDTTHEPSSTDNNSEQMKHQH